MNCYVEKKPKVPCFLYRSTKKAQKMCFNIFEKTQIMCLKDIVDKAENYSPEIKKRVIDLLLETKRRYKYLFK